MSNMGGRDEDIRNKVENLPFSDLEKGALYHLMGMETNYSTSFEELPQGPKYGNWQWHNKLTRMLTWGRAYIHGDTTVDFEKWLLQHSKGGVVISGNGEFNTSTPERARQTFRATHKLSAVSRPADESNWTLIIALLLICAGLAYFVAQKF